MYLNNLDEIQIIKRLTLNLKKDKSILRHIGDDTAVIKFNARRLLLFTSDMLIEGVHFDLKKASWQDIGHKALARNISDVAAMGGLPKYITVSLGLPGKYSYKKIETLYRGIRKTADKYGVIIAGGDIARSKHLIVNIALIGAADRKDVTYRHQAKEGDVIFVTGSLGGSIKGKHLKFSPRVKEAQYLVKKFKPNAMIDLSDGLAQDLGHILCQSRVGAKLYQKNIPLSKEAGCFENALYDGEDFELLFTVSKYKANKLFKSWRKSFRLKISQIGVIVNKKEGFYYLDCLEKKKIIRPLGRYRHFK
jgi:thiamine-monophosphate kinase